MFEIKPTDCSEMGITYHVPILYTVEHLCEI